MKTPIVVIGIVILIGAGFWFQSQFEAAPEIKMPATQPVSAEEGLPEESKTVAPSEPKVSIPSQKHADEESAGGKANARDEVLTVAKELQSQLTAGNYSLVISRLEKILEQSPDASWALSMAGEIYAEHLNEPDKARGFLERAVAINPDDSHSIARIVSIGYEQQNPQQALDFLSQVEKENSQSAAVHHHMGKLLLEKGDVRAAVRKLEKAKDHPEFDRASIPLLAEGYARLGRVKKAEFQYKQLIRELKAQRKQDASGRGKRYYDRAIARKKLKIAQLYVKEDPAKAELLLEEAETILGSESSMVKYTRKRLESTGQ